MHTNERTFYAAAIVTVILLCMGAPRSLASTATSAPASQAGPPSPDDKSIILRVGELRACFRPNPDSKPGLSGIDWLFNEKAAPGFDAFDPDSPNASAGLNFEHITCGHPNRPNMFTPRGGPYILHALPGGRSVQLVRRAEDDPWKVSSTMTYDLHEPNCIDFEFRCRIHDKTLFGRRGWGLFFWANYMNDVQDHAIHFLGVEAPGGEPKWIRAHAPPGHPDHDHGGTYRSLPASDLGMDNALKERLNVWSYDYPRFTKPFYYGRAAHGMVYILMFDRMYSPDDEIRFSLFTFKLKQFPRPAWDFQYVIHNVDETREFGFRGRAVWKPFVSPDDCLHEYETWAQGLK